MKRIFSTSLIAFIFLLLAFPTHAFTNGFNVTSDEELITLVGESGSSYSLTINLETSDPTLTTYPVGLSLPSISSYSATNSWISFSQSSLNIVNTNTTPLNFTLTIPSDTDTGEYYKAVAVSDMPYIDGESSNAPTLLAIPITIQVSKTATPSSSTSNSSSSSTTSNSSSSTTSTSTNTQLTPSITPIKKYYPKHYKVDPKKTPDIFSKLLIEKLITNYNLLKQTTEIELLIKNEGNISTFPTGSIQVLNKNKNAVKIFPLNNPKLQIKPKQSTVFNYTLNNPKYLIGFFETKVFLGDQSTQNEIQPQPLSTKKIFHLGQYPLYLFFLLIVTIVVAKPKSRYKITIVSLSIVGIGLCYYSSHRPANYKYLGEQSDLEITATIKEQVGIRAIINNDLSKTILFTSTNSLGSHLFSLQNETRNSLDQISQYTYGSYTTDLTYPHSDLPIMMITNGY